MRSMFSRASAQLAFVAVLAACRAEMPEVTSQPASVDSSFNGSEVEVADTQPIDATMQPEQPSVVEPSAGLLTPDGWGPLRIGMSRADVVAAAGEDADPEAVGGPDPDQCDEFRPSNAPAGVLVMVENGVLTRISVSRNRDIRTLEGFRVGDPDTSVLAEYGSRAQVDSHPYWQPPAKYITVWRARIPEAAARGIRYEIDSSGEIVHLRAGGRSIEYSEGCV